jgi:hypothetical protein
VFVGAVTAVAGDRVTVTVTDVWKGTVAATVTVTTSPGQCKFVRHVTVKVGKAYLFAATSGSAGLAVRLCDGVERSTRPLRARLVELLGAPTAP